MRLFSLVLMSVLALGSIQPALAKVKTGANKGTESGNGPSPTILVEDAIRLCQLIVDNERAILDALEFEGWSQNVEYNIGNAPFYKEITASIYYDGVGEVEIWGYLENYPGYDIGYCAYTIADPQLKISLAPVNALEGFDGEIEVEGAQSYGAWRSEGENPDTFIHAYQNLDTFVYQITRIAKFD